MSMKQLNTTVSQCIFVLHIHSGCKSKCSSLPAGTCGGADAVHPHIHICNGGTAISFHGELYCSDKGS